MSTPDLVPFFEVPGHPEFVSDTPVLAGMLLEEGSPWAADPAGIRVSVAIRLSSPIGSAPVPAPLALEPSAVHDPPEVSTVEIIRAWSEAVGIDPDKYGSGTAPPPSPHELMRDGFMTRGKRWDPA